MVFFDLNGNPISYPQWVSLYNQFYYLGGPTHPPGFHIGHQTSLWVENHVTGPAGLLTQATPLTLPQLTIAMAWKVGRLINQNASQAAQAIVYRPHAVNWPTTLSASSGFRKLNFSQSIHYLASNMTTVRHHLITNPQYLLSLKLRAFGPVYKLAMQFFLTNGSSPLYDQMAHKAALAIDQNRPPFSTVSGYSKNKTVSWNDYLVFQALLRRIGLQPHGTMFISRDDDRALWVYGHFYGP
jgi:hypothetical protein